MQSPIPFVLAVTATAAASLVAQCPPSSGPLAGTPMAISVGQSRTGPPADATLEKLPGFHTVLPGRASSTAGPTFDLQVILRNCQQPPIVNLDVDAISLGLDWILADHGNGRVLVPANRWGAITFSVTRDSRGAAGSVIRDEANRPDGNGADVFSYVLRGSAVPGELVGRTERAVDGREIDLGDGAEIDGLDAVIPMFGLEPGMRAFLPDEPTIYFSLTSASAAMAPRGWYATGGASGASILYVTWNARLRQWSCPAVYRSYRDMQLVQADELDALALDIPNRCLLFSTKNPALSQVMFQSMATDAAPVPYADVDGVAITEKIGLLPGDDVDAVCALDPSIRSHGNELNAWHFSGGTPRPATTFGWIPGFTASVFRGVQGAGLPTFETYLTGWPVGGAQNGAAILCVTLPDSLNPIVVVGHVLRTPPGTHCGSPEKFVLPIPANLSLKGFTLNLRWFAADAAITAISEAHPQLIRL